VLCGGRWWTNEDVVERIEDVAGVIEDVLADVKMMLNM
jgi:hypothetical protein